jgi:tetratricopeptide (TPR) repeat protein
MSTRHTYGPGLALLAAWMCTATAYAQERVPPANDRTSECGKLHNSTGPHDFRDPDPARRWDVNDTWKNHYDPAITRMNQGEFSQRVMHDIDFLLRVFPNHVPALRLLMDFERGGGKLAAYRTVDCYFDRARRFASDDVPIVLLEAAYFKKKGNNKRARESYEDALLMLPESADVTYAAGLFYADVGEYPRAVELAKMAYGRGYPLPGLQRKLAEHGYHVEMEEETTAAAVKPPS